MCIEFELLEVKVPAFFLAPWVSRRPGRDGMSCDIKNLSASRQKISSNGTFQEPGSNSGAAEDATCPFDDTRVNESDLLV